MLSATDVANFLACHHLSTLERAEERGEIQKPFFHDPGVDLLRELGNRHEARYLEHLTGTQSGQIARIPTEISWNDAVGRTTEAIQSGADVVYQATFQSGASAVRTMAAGPDDGMASSRGEVQLVGIFSVV